MTMQLRTPSSMDWPRLRKRRCKPQPSRPTPCLKLWTPLFSKWLPRRTHLCGTRNSTETRSRGTLWRKRLTRAIFRRCRSSYKTAYAKPNLISRSPTSPSIRTRSIEAAFLSTPNFPVAEQKPFHGLEFPNKNVWLVDDIMIGSLVTRKRKLLKFKPSNK